jgi:hypothetical protein
MKVRDRGSKCIPLADMEEKWRRLPRSEPPQSLLAGGFIGSV